MESNRFRRRAELPGVEVLEVVESQRPWRCFTSAFELMLPENWRGHIAYRGVRHRIEPGMLFCPGPGDSFEVSAEAPGSFRVLMLEREAMTQLLAEHQLSPEALDVHRVIASPDAELTSALVRVLDDVCLEAPIEAVQASLRALGCAIAQKLGRARQRAKGAPSLRAAERVRELIHADEEGTLDLDSLSRQIGLSRFQVLRLFKRAFGLPPHAYQLCVRIAQAKRLLCMGHRPAYVATELRFADQSHLNRHFKRLLGVTPSEYAQAAAG
jgi:AraC-like DNA-binding protein